MKLKLLTLALTLGFFALGANVNAAHEKVNAEAEAQMMAQAQGIVDDIMAKLLSLLGTQQTEVVCAKDKLFRQLGGAACCAPVGIPGFKKPVPGCENSAAFAEAICKGVGGFDTSTCGKALPADVKSNPAAKIKAVLAKDPSGLIAKGLCHPTATYPVGSAIGKLADFVKKNGVCPAAAK